MSLERDRISDEIYRLLEIIQKRNKSLAWLILVKFGMNIRPYPLKYESRRGAKSYFPIKAVMEILNCTHRTAQDYVRTLKALSLIDNYANIKRGT
ncbi:hypothetical protein KAS14_04660 [Candidatus Bathyarchaeota archaeon]|nr:hypothetical protein [Candidatus Bathyarchaeota archaeon]